ncbi:MULTISPECIES: succinylglutamate desuccinylase/aspartoacylase family protein [unclassified Micromonospora]|uniref:succinylglutamate desuccinylase/aspartoacylase family protein n=1 Tax=unclassified Micromonospora TaxID=2617518 RepID=UPI00331B3C31
MSIVRDSASPGLPDVIEIVGHAAGPTVAVLGGVHGDEPEGVLAARRIAGLLDPAELRGTVRISAPAHPAAWNAVTRTSPVDGLNLARVFPGNADGQPTERIAAFLTSRVIAGADLLVDLHSAGQGLDMPLLAGYHAGTGPICARSADAAAVFGAPFVWRHPRLSPGRSLAAAAAEGVPSIYVEGRGGGQVRRADLDCYVAGVLRVLHRLGMVPSAPPAPAPVVVDGDGDTDGGIQAEARGYLVTAVEVGDHVAAGALLGEVVDGNGAPVAPVRSPHAGVVMLLRRRAHVDPGDTLAIVARVARAEGGAER